MSSETESLEVNCSLKLPIKFLIPRKIAAALDTRCTSYTSAVRESVGNEFSSELGPKFRDGELSKQ